MYEPARTVLMHPIFFVTAQDHHHTPAEDALV
jgi:hypothetical protein